MERTLFNMFFWLKFLACEENVYLNGDRSKTNAKTDFANQYNDNRMETPAIRVVNVFIENDEYIMLCVVVGIN